MVKAYAGISAANAARHHRSQEKKNYVTKLFSADPEMPNSEITAVLKNKFGGSLAHADIEEQRPAGAVARKIKRKHTNHRKSNAVSAVTPLTEVCKLLKAALEAAPVATEVIARRSPNGDVKVTLYTLQGTDI